MYQWSGNKSDGSRDQIAKQPCHSDESLRLPNKMTEYTLFIFMSGLFLSSFVFTTVARIFHFSLFTVCQITCWSLVM